VQAVTDGKVVDYTAGYADTFDRGRRLLSAAVALYESAGFHHEAPPSPSEYERADIFMVYRQT
jgi:hypothetical protein